MNCKQTKCCFLGTPLCPTCKECGSPANVVNENCTTCWNCEHDINELRGKINLGMKEDVKVKEDEIKEKLMEIKVG